MEKKKKIESYKDLWIWQKSVELVKRIHTIESVPESERYSILSQMKRSSVSIPSNIAEGWGRGQTGSFIYFLIVIKGSLYELETQLILSRELNLMMAQNADELLHLIDELGRMISGLQKSLKRKVSSGRLNEPNTEYTMSKIDH